MHMWTRLLAAGCSAAGLLAASALEAANYTTLNADTIPSSINSSGSVAGNFVDASGIQHGFVWINGTYTFFDPAGSTETFANGINDTGTITGFWLDASLNAHGFIRDAAGAIASFDAVSGARRTYGWSINKRGDVGGDYFGPSGWAAFTRRADGQVISFSVPGAASTSGANINDKDEIGGYYLDANSVAHAFIKAPESPVIKF